jgi:hypothetical protein
MSPRARDLRRRDGGWISLEFVGMSFFLFLMLMLAIQVAAATWTLAQADGAARAAARQATLSRGFGGQSAASAAVNPSLRSGLIATGSSTGDGQTWRVTLRVPKVLPRMPDWTITRSASMPSTEPGFG